MGGRRAVRRVAPVVSDPIEVTAMAHDGRGIASLDGKRVFIQGALPGETVSFRVNRRTRDYDEAEVVDVLTPAPERVVPRCAAYARCGGCSLQHMDPAAQILAKQQILLDNLRHIGQVSPERVLPPLTGPVWGYRRKARLGVRWVRAKDRVLVGFRERRSSFIAEAARCEVLDETVGGQLEPLAALIGGLSIADRLPQIEVAVTDILTVLVLRVLDAPSAADLEALRAFGIAHQVQFWLQPKGPDSAAPIPGAWAPEHMLGYRLPQDALEMRFRPHDFTQVNEAMNRAMVAQAMALLDPAPNHRLLDLFCGLGNFTLPMARRTREVVGVEGDADLVAQARSNAERHGLTHARFLMANLYDTAALDPAPWGADAFDGVLLDPPRSGAREVLAAVAATGARRVVYVSCHPATLARDAGDLVRLHGFQLEAAGVMDMFPHTGHVESVALFVREGGCGT
ncbi:MAG: 23S rRNA (uracil(1939)-C(5))-methyltransferase RlmD [Pseudomonadota bacterium]|nr:23S rRNA (uracil(1939)-C(5))-methyltransferase RlmD [Pseudomonadota bacterium]